MLRTIAPDEFARRLAAMEIEPDRKFALFLGAGCSVSSGIPDAYALVRDNWLPRLRDLRAPTRKDIHEWAREIFADYESSAPARIYGRLIAELFLNPDDRQREIERLCEDKFPGFGYATLASLMARPAGAFSVAITTNFDDLIADALYLFSPVRPLVISHQSLATYIRATRTRPLVVKVHGDHRLSPQNTAEETGALQAEIEARVCDLLQDRGLIFVGYSGNDGGITQMLKSLSNRALPNGVYWIGTEEPRGVIREWLESRDAIFVPATDFDEFMLLVYFAFSMQQPNRERFVDVFDRYFDKFNELNTRISGLREDRTDAAGLKSAAEYAAETFSNWRSVAARARALEDTNIDEAERVYQQGLAQFPLSADLVGAYAVFLTQKREDHDRAEVLFRESVALQPNNSRSLANLAIFLDSVRGNIDEAERCFAEAAHQSDVNATALAGYANLLDRRRRDPDQVEALYKAALRKNPNSAPTLANFALFLRHRRGRINEAEQFLTRALEIAPNDAGILDAFAVFLTEVRGDKDRAEELFKRALAVEPNRTTLLVNYARFMSRERNETEAAKELYERAIQLDPKHALAHANYAAHLHEKTDNVEAAGRHYEIAIGLVPNNAAVGTAYAAFLVDKRRDYATAESVFQRAIDADEPDSQVRGRAIGAYAAFLDSIRKDVARAEEMYQRAVAADTANGSNLGNYAHFLWMKKDDKEKAAEFFERAAAASPRNSGLLGLYALFLHSALRDYDAAERVYLQSIDADSKNTNALITYGDFLSGIRRKPADADVMFRRALDIEPESVFALSALANLRFRSFDEVSVAEDMFRRAYVLDPKNIVNTINFAGVLLAIGKTEEGLLLLDEMRGELETGNSPAAVIEFWFYLYAHGKIEQRTTALRELKRLAEKGDRSIGWDLSANVERAKRDQHPEGVWLGELARALTTSDGLDVLKEWKAWNDA